MKRALIFLAAAVLAILATAAAVERPLTYYVQLVRCSDRDQPPEPGARRVGPKLAERFRCVLGCKTYWEIGQAKLEVYPNRAGRVHLTNGRDVEIDLSHPGKRKVSTFLKGRLIDRTVEPLSEDMTLIGGERDHTSHWFIVVRRDKPGK